MTYKGTNIGLEYDAETGTWEFKNIAQDFIDPNTFSSTDPDFEYAPVEPTTTEPEEPDCPAGYVYDATLKQCVPDTNYQNPFMQPDKTYQKDDNENGAYIPSNETKELWIKNANIIIPPGQEGAGKTGYQNFIDNLSNRGWIKTENGKMIFKKDNIGSAIGAAMLGKVGGQAEVSSKTNKIIKDLQRMGGVDAQINMNDDGEIDFASELELADSPGVFATYNYDGTDLMGGNYTGFTTPNGNTFSTTGTFGTTGYTSAWNKYMSAVMQPSSKTSTALKTSIIKKDYGDGFAYDKEMAIKEKERIEIDKAKEKLKQEKIKTNKAIEESALSTQNNYEKASGSNQQKPKKIKDTYSKPNSGTTGSGNAQVNPHTQSGYSGGSNKPKKPKKPKTTTKPKKSFNIHG